MAYAGRIGQGPHPARRRSARRRRGARDGTNWSASDDKYGHRRIGALYVIGKILSHFVDSVESTVPLLLEVVARELPLLSVTLVERTTDEPKTLVWHAAGLLPERIRAAEQRAMKSFSYFTGFAAPPVKAVDLIPISRARSRAAKAAALASKRGKYLTLPLVVEGQPPFGTLHIEGAASFDEEDVEFVSAIANQLAITLDRFHARLAENELRRQAEASARLAREEVERRKGIQEELRKLNAGLEQRVLERTVQYQETIRELHAFTYSVAHDLRAPLRHIHGYGEVIAGGKTGAESLDYARRIMSASSGMDLMIKDLLSYSRLTLEEISLGVVSLSAVVADVVERVKADLAERKGSVSVQKRLPAVVANKILLTQAIGNLLSNAVKFVPEGVGPRVRIEAEARGGRVRLWVRDNGIGIAREHHERVFGVFQRLHKIEDYPGTGIGLAIVRRAMERMKGFSGVESEPGKGSAFWIELEKAEHLR